jgi:Transposase DDE domain/Transposase domain (DUF772)
MSAMAGLGTLWNSIQTWLFPMLEDELGELDEKHREFVAVCETCAPQAHMAAYRWVGNGCPPNSRLALCKAFIAKAVWDFPTTRDLIDAVRHRPTLRRLCGWETLAKVPSESTFSRAFAAFAEDELPQCIQEAMIANRYGDKIAGHISRDATAIHGREKAAKKESKATPRPDSEASKAPPEPTRLQRQLERPLDENLADLPRVCDWGTKKDSKGKKQTWRGYKLHLDAIDGDIPVSWLVTSASLHDSQAAIPLAQMSAQRVTSLYDLADAAYDAKEIRQMSERLGHVALIDHNPRRGEKRELAPAEAIRYRQRSSAERVNSQLHDNHGGRHVRVRGDVKVVAHLSFGLLVIAAEQLLRLVC